MTDLEKFQKVNSCETVQELEDTIKSFCNSNGDIQVRTRVFDGIKMASKVKYVVEEKMPANVLTREFGIRQQALYLAYYDKL